MTLVKIFFILMLTYLIFQVIQFLSRISRFFKTIKAATTQGYQRRYDDNNMVKCARCSLYIPYADAISYEGRLYCSKEHAK